MKQILKEENIIDSNAAWTEANVVTSLQIKKHKTHLLLYLFHKNQQIEPIIV